MLNQYLIYEYNDMASFLLKGLERHLGRSLTSFSSGFSESFQVYTGMLSGILSKFLFKQFSPIIAANLHWILYAGLSFIFAYIFFRELTKDKWVSITFSTFYTFSIYFLFRVVSLTTNLYPTFIFPLILFLLLKNQKPFIIALVVCFSFLLTPYYGFMAFFLVVFWYLSVAIFNKSPKPFIKSVLKFVLPVIAFTLILWGGVLLRNSPLLGMYQEDITQQSTKPTFYRSIEDYYNFSFRPWYFLIPPQASIYFHNFSNSTFTKIQETGYYLAGDYTELEAGGSYLGWHFLVGILFAIYLYFKKPKGYSFFNKKRSTIFIALFSIILILLISHPPSFTIRGVRIYTPSFIMYQLFPFIRVLTRWSVVIYLLALAINAFTLSSMFRVFSSKLLKAFVLVVVILMTYVIFAVELPIINLEKPPPEIRYLDSVLKKENERYVVYPSADYYSIFWNIRHQGYLVNPPDNQRSWFDSEEFSKNMVTKDGIGRFKDFGATYLVVYRKRWNLDDVREINSNIKTEGDLLEYWQEEVGPIVYKDGNVYVFKVRNIN